MELAKGNRVFYYDPNTGERIKAQVKQVFKEKVKLRLTSSMDVITVPIDEVELASLIEKKSEDRTFTIDNRVFNKFAISRGLGTIRAITEGTRGETLYEVYWEEMEVSALDLGRELEDAGLFEKHKAQQPAEQDIDFDTKSDDWLDDSINQFMYEEGHTDLIVATFPETQTTQEENTMIQIVDSDILEALPTGHVEIASSLGLPCPDVKAALKDLEKRALVEYDEYKDVWMRKTEEFKDRKNPNLETVTIVATPIQTETIETVTIDEATPKERLNQLKGEILQISEKVRLAFYEIGKRLGEIADKKLYEIDGYADFEEFAFKEFGFKKSFAYYQISAAQVYSEIKSVSTNSGKECIKETHLRSLTKEDFSSDDRVAIWEQVTSELENLESEGKPAKLTAKLVEKHVMSYQESQVANPPELPPLNAGAYCRVRLRSGHIDSSLAKWNNQIVRFLRYGNMDGCICESVFGEEIQDVFFREEIFELADTATHKFSVELTVEQLKQLPRSGSLENAIAYLLPKSAEGSRLADCGIQNPASSTANVVEFPQKASAS